MFINHLATTYVSPSPSPYPHCQTNPPSHSANEFTTSANKKTIMPADVFKALEETEYGFMVERVEAEFASPSPLSLPLSSTSHHQS